MSAHSLYAPIEAHRSGFLRVDPLHSLYWEESGARTGAPILFLHGGPGGGCAPGHRRFFDPKHYRIVMFDQRGAGRSKPNAEIRGNDTPSLIEDIETLRAHLGIERWILFGGSWGSTLALAYAQTHPHRTVGLILRGVFLGRRSEVDWFFEGMRVFHPEAWRDFTNFLSSGERAKPMWSYYRRLCDPDPAIHRPAASSWTRYEARCATLKPNPKLVAQLGDADSALALARLEAHYFVNDLFLEPDQLLRGADRLTRVPGRIVQGRYDSVCPPVSAFELAQVWQAAELEIIDEAGHSANEPPITTALVRAANDFRELG